MSMNLVQLPRSSAVTDLAANMTVGSEGSFNKSLFAILVAMTVELKSLTAKKADGADETNVAFGQNPAHWAVAINLNDVNASMVHGTKTADIAFVGAAAAGNFLDGGASLNGGCITIRNSDFSGKNVSKESSHIVWSQFLPILFLGEANAAMTDEHPSSLVDEMNSETCEHSGLDVDVKAILASLAPITIKMVILGLSVHTDELHIRMTETLNNL